MAEKHFFTAQPPESKDQAVAFRLSDVARIEGRVHLKDGRAFDLDEEEMLRLLGKRRDEKLEKP